MNNNSLYIGDNLTILKTLPDNSVDHIFTDPPYNTGSKKMTYKDQLQEAEWLSFMQQRLVECHRVLKETGTLLIFIDQNMQVELQNLLYTIFGKKNYITTFVWKKKSSSSAQSKYATIEHDYIIAVAKNIKKCQWNGVPQFEPKDTANSPFSQHGEKRESGNDNNKYPLFIEGQNGKLADQWISSKVGLAQSGPNQNYPLYVGDDGTQLSQRFDKVSKTDRNPETRPKECYPLHIDGWQNKPHFQVYHDGYDDCYNHPFMSTEGAAKSRPKSDDTYPIHHNSTKISLTPFPGSVEVFPMNDKKLGCWRAIPATCQKLIDADMLVVKNGKIYQKQYAHFRFNKKTCQLEPFVRTTPIRTILMGDKYPTNLRSNKEIKEIYGESRFTYAKPLDLIKNLIKIISKEGETILDIFAGTGTTGQAAFETNRQFILIQLDEGNIPELTQIRLDMKVGKDNYQIIK
jgi:DNA modification methylase